MIELIKLFFQINIVAIIIMIVFLTMMEGINYWENPVWKGIFIYLGIVNLGILLGFIISGVCGKCS